MFLCAHEIGAHYTYAMVPYDEALRSLTGQSLDALLGFRRNHYDRLVHFLFGLLLLPLAVELFEAKAPPRGAWRWLMPVLFIEALSAVFELIEWLAASLFGGELGQAYLGTQGDVWDAQRDMALALLGAAVAQVALMFCRRRRLSDASRGRIRPGHGRTLHACEGESGEGSGSTRPYPLREPGDQGDQSGHAGKVDAHR